MEIMVAGTKRMTDKISIYSGKNIFLQLLKAGFTEILGARTFNTYAYEILDALQANRYESAQWRDGRKTALSFVAQLNHMSEEQASKHFDICIVPGEVPHGKILFRKK